MSTLTADRIRDHAARLGLTHLSDTITELVTRAETAQMGYLDFVDLLLEEEVGLREGRRFRNALKLSGLPHHKTLDQFDFAFQPGLDVRKIKDLATLEFVKAKSNVALLGPPGVGKTMLAVALAVTACQAGFPHLLHHPRRPGPPAPRRRSHRPIQPATPDLATSGRPGRGPMPTPRLCRGDRSRGWLFARSRVLWPLLVSA
jgi:Mrp family chromosome partitioning ATPase